MIVFACARCGTKFKVKTQFAGRSSKCPTCQQPLLVPAVEQTEAHIPAGQIDGSASSLHRAGVEGGVTLQQAKNAEADQSISQLLARSRKGERYLLQGEIARGGMGAVLRAIDCDIRREVAVKFLLDQTDARKKLRFIEEAQITGQLEHPNIVPIHELGIDAAQRMFFSMKMVKGRSLAQVLDELRNHPKPAEREWPLSRLLNVFVGVCHALAYAHSRGVVHRDLKPANIMVGDFGEVYVMDWGLAKVLSGEEPSAPVAQMVADSSIVSLEAVPLSSGRKSKVDTTRAEEADLTQDGAILGTPAYMPPEQAKGKLGDIDQRSDVYSLGAILYEMLTLLPPIDKEGGYIAVLMRVVEGAIVPPEQRAPQRARAGKVPRELSAIALKALARDKEQRYPGVEALRQDLERFREGRSVSAKQDSAVEMVVKLVKRNKALSAAAAVLLVVFLWGSWINWQERRATRQALDNYTASQKEKEEQFRVSLPALLRAARQTANENNFPDAHKQLAVILDFEPNYAPAHLLKAQLFLGEQKFADARTELQLCLAQEPRNVAARTLADSSARATPQDATALAALADLLFRQELPAPAQRLTQAAAKTVDGRNRLLAQYQERLNRAWGLGGNLGMDANGKFYVQLVNQGRLVKDLSPLKGIPLTALDLSNCSDVHDLSPLEGMPLVSLKLDGCGQVLVLGPLKGMPLSTLSLMHCGQVRDLTPLKDMPLKGLNLYGCGQVRDLTPLKGMPLTNLNLGVCSQVYNLSPLTGMPLTKLDLTWCSQVRDLTPLMGMPLTWVNFSGCTQVRDLTPLKNMPLTWAMFDRCDELRDLTPLKDLKSLTHLSIISSAQVRDLTPLKDLPLKELDVYNCLAIEALTPLKDLKLTFLGVPNSRAFRDMPSLKKLPLGHISLKGCNQVDDLKPLEGFKPGWLTLTDCSQVRDLTPLKGMPLRGLDLGNCGQVQDLKPLAEMKLTWIRLEGCGSVSSLEPLKDMKLTWIDLRRCGKVRDLSPLKDMDLKEIKLEGAKTMKGLEVLRAMPTLGVVQVDGKDLSLADFRKKFDAGEFKP